ncbi:MAG: hypothetical protein MJ189_04155, partial [Coriobacteriales bacterium]|nr:hypothetical protein [Coriobacteriales bacterium]
MTPLGKNTSKHMKSSLPKPKKGLQQPKGQHTRPSVKNKANIKNVIPKVNRNAESSMQAKPNINRTIPSLNTKTIPSKQSQPNISNAIPKIQETKTARPSTSNKSNTNGSFSTEQIQATNGKVHLSPEQSRQNMDARHIAPEQS